MTREEICTELNKALSSQSKINIFIDPKRVSDIGCLFDMRERNMINFNDWQEAHIKEMIEKGPPSAFCWNLPEDFMVTIGFSNNFDEFYFVSAMEKAIKKIRIIG